MEISIAGRVAMADWKKLLAGVYDSERSNELDWKNRLQHWISRGFRKPKIVNFDLARFSSSAASYVPSVTIAGTLLTEKVDVYNFGVLVLEIVSGVRNNKLRSHDTFETLVTHVWKYYQSNTVSEIIEKSLAEEDSEEVERFVQVGLSKI
ncbi:hypothetical protein F8388_019986 [Cannabis sativa]|uniref:Serine-threonine/tyrosine-protein kinase catalytic domain-containing protein n=1 Tax=Cannabis sativa TaxID=3483 RepID=A0A7J6GW82_CANSA|nr:hypothetical protein F8388_019986 [Cannabis sativa]KAF4398768.1 hypothetical protein G4B88_028131 [Cannabis sativa]